MDYIPKRFRDNLTDIIFYLENQFNFLSSYNTSADILKNDSIAKRLIIDLEENCLYAAGVKSECCKYSLEERKPIGFSSKSKL